MRTATEYYSFTGRELFPPTTEDRTMKPIYASIEQQAAIQDGGRLDLWYVVVTETPFGADEYTDAANMSGPYTGDDAERILSERIASLQSAGRTVYTVDTAPGDWAMGGLYIPPAD